MAGFEDTTAEFASQFHCLKELAKELRSILFPIRDTLTTGTCKDRNVMYDWMMHTFPKTTGGLEQ